MYILKLEDGIWLATHSVRTLVKAIAKQFVKFTQAKTALNEARNVRPFENARIVDVRVST